MNFLKTMKKPLKWLIIIVGICFCVSLAVWLVHFPGVRRVFKYESSDNGRIRMEVRYEPVFPVQGRLCMYVDELLLGPETARCRPLFTPGTKALSCFKRGGKLYVNLSEDLLTEGGGASEIKKGIELFRKNILYNFENIHTVEVFVGGRLAYEDSLIGQKKR